MVVNPLGLLFVSFILDWVLEKPTKLDTLIGTDQKQTPPLYKQRTKKIGTQ